MPEEPEEQDAPGNPEDLEDPGHLADLDEDEDEQPLFGRFDAATLLAVEGANGGEWAGLGQVLATFQSLFGELPEADGFAESCGLLCDAGLVDYEGDGFDLSPAGRKLLRRAGRHGSAERPGKVAELLGRYDENDLGAEGAVATPTTADVAAALEGLTDEVALEFGGVLASNEMRRVGAPTMFGVGSARPLGIDPMFGGDGLLRDDGEPDAGGTHDAEPDAGGPDAGGPDGGRDDAGADWPEDLDEDDEREDWSPDAE